MTDDATQDDAAAKGPTANNPPEKTEQPAAKLPEREPDIITKGEPPFEKLPERTPDFRTLTRVPDPDAIIIGPPKSLQNDDDCD